MIRLDVAQGFDVPGRGEFEGTVDLIETSDEVLIEGAGATSNEGIGDVTEVVTDVTGTLLFAPGGGGEVGTLLLGGVGVLVVDGLSGAVDKGVSFGGELAGSFEGVLGALKATEGGVQLGVAQETTLGVGGSNGLGEGSLLHLVEEKKVGTEERVGSAGENHPIQEQPISRQQRRRDRSRCRSRKRERSNHRG